MKKKSVFIDGSEYSLSDIDLEKGRELVKTEPIHSSDLVPSKTQIVEEPANLLEFPVALYGRKSGNKNWVTHRVKDIEIRIGTMYGALRPRDADLLLDIFPRYMFEKKNSCFLILSESQILKDLNIPDNWKNRQRIMKRIDKIRHTNMDYYNWKVRQKRDGKLETFKVPVIGISLFPHAVRDDNGVWKILCHPILYKDLYIKMLRKDILLAIPNSHIKHIYRYLDKKMGKGRIGTHKEGLSKLMIKLAITDIQVGRAKKNLIVFLEELKKAFLVADWKFTYSIKGNIFICKKEKRQRLTGLL